MNVEECIKNSLRNHIVDDAAMFMVDITDFVKFLSTNISKDEKVLQKNLNKILEKLEEDANTLRWYTMHRFLANMKEKNGMGQSLGDLLLQKKTYALKSIIYPFFFPCLYTYLEKIQEEEDERLIEIFWRYLNGLIAWSFENEYLQKHIGQMLK
jgi:hypothetical protein